MVSTWEPTERPFDHHLSARLDVLITDLESCECPVRRRYLKAWKRWYERTIPAFGREVAR